MIICISKTFLVLTTFRWCSSRTLAIKVAPRSSSECPRHRPRCTWWVMPGWKPVFLNGTPLWERAGFCSDSPKTKRDHTKKMKRFSFLEGGLPVKDLLYDLSCVIVRTIWVPLVIRKKGKRHSESELGLLRVPRELKKRG
jgi:hypothetical protein